VEKHYTLENQRRTGMIAPSLSPPEKSRKTRMVEELAAPPERRQDVAKESFTAQETTKVDGDGRAEQSVAIETASQQKKVQEEEKGFHGEWCELRRCCATRSAD
jgi:hypothetical protein